MKQVLVLALALAISPAIAGNNNGPDYGDVTTNNNQTYNQPTANAGALAGAVSGSASNAQVGDVTNIAAGGQGGRGGDGGNSFATGGIGLGGSAHQGQSQGQQQGQGQQQSNVGINGQSQSNVGVNTSSNVLGQAQSTDASSSNDNRSTASGNATSVRVEGDVYEAKRNAPGIVGGNVFPTASCKGGFSIGGSGTAGGGLLNIATTDRECQTIVLAQNFSAVGKNATACTLLTTTKAWARAVKKNPALAVDCSK